MKLQKLLYYVKVWTLVANKDVFEPHDAFFAWKYGPVNPSLYHLYKNYGSSVISEKPEYPSINDEDKELIDFILKSYSFFDAITLSKTTHAEDPWILNKDSRSRIKNSQMLEYYSNEMFAKNFPLGESDKYYPPNTISHHSFVFDMNENDSATSTSFKSVDEYLSLLKESKNLAKKYIPEKMF